jgi:carbonic anhydrase
MNALEELLSANKKWAGKMVESDPLFFENLVNVQSPDFLWIGCSDSRVPPNQITQTTPGQIFIHRNIANMVVHTDLNLLSVLQYAVEILKVKHIIVCGHYGCGGVKAAMTNHSYGLINKWLRNIKDVYRYHQDEIEMLETEDEKLNRLIELNVSEQVLESRENFHRPEILGPKQWPSFAWMGVRPARWCHPTVITLASRI